MSTENLPTVPATSVTFSPEAFTAMTAEARRLGLPIDAYLLAIHAVQTGRITKQSLESIGEIYTRDHEILRELAK